MQIHELDKFSGELGAHAYVAVDSGTNTGKVSTQEIVAPAEAAVSALDTQLNARIDNIIAGGAAPSASEIVDARYGANGVTYASLGDSIRGQITDVQDNVYLNGYFPGSIILSKSDFQQGFVGNNGFDRTGADANKYITYIASSKIAKGSTVHCECNGQYASIAIYQSGQWSAPNTLLQSIPSSLNPSLFVEQDGYLVVTISTSPEYAQRTAITVDDFNSYIAINTNIVNMIDATFMREKIEIGSDQFARGYIDASGIKNNDAEARKYLYYLSSEKVTKGSRIQFSSGSVYCSVQISPVKNPTTGTTMLQTHAADNDYSMLIENDGYILIIVSNGKVYADRTEIVPADIDITISLLPSYENRFTELENEIKLIGSTTRKLTKSDFIQGYPTTAGYIGSGSDQNKYISCLIDQKVLRNTRVTVNCPNHYCAITVWDSNAWQSAKTALQTYPSPPGQSFEFVANFDGYISITIMTAPVYADRTAIYPADYEEDITIYPFNDRRPIYVDNSAKGVFCVMSYNCGEWYTGEATPVPDADYDEISAMQHNIIDRYNPDILCLQEYGDNFTSSISALSEILADRYYYNYSYDGGSHYIGKDISTSRSIENVTLTKFTNTNEDRKYEKGYIYLNGRKVCLINTHLEVNSTSIVGLQCDELLSVISGEEYVIICLDTNINEFDQESSAYIESLKKFKDAGYILANDGRYETYPQGAMALDDIIITSNINIKSAMVDTQKSAHSIRQDHYPFIAYLEVY